LTSIFSARDANDEHGRTLRGFLDFGKLDNKENRARFSLLGE